MSQPQTNIVSVNFKSKDEKQLLKAMKKSCVNSRGIKLNSLRKIGFMSNTPKDVTN